jgi:hypothetical protein
MLMLLAGPFSIGGNHHSAHESLKKRKGARSKITLLVGMIDELDANSII